MLHQSASIISVSKNLYGERMKPGSIRLEDDSTNNTVVIVDDGKGNLYDLSVSSSFAKFSSQSFSVNDHTESFAGNVLHQHLKIYNYDDFHL